MPLFVIPFPQIDPILVEFGPFAIRWYALAYIAGLLIGWRLALALVATDQLWGARAHPDRLAIDDLLVYMAFGIVLGGRLGQVVFYDFAYFSAHPAEIFAVWHGGMAFLEASIVARIAWHFLLGIAKRRFCLCSTSRPSFHPSACSLVASPISSMANYGAARPMWLGQ